MTFVGFALLGPCHEQAHMNQESEISVVNVHERSKHADTSSDSKERELLQITFSYTNMTLTPP